MMPQCIARCVRTKQLSRCAKGPAKTDFILGKQPESPILLNAGPCAVLRVMKCLRPIVLIGFVMIFCMNINSAPKHPKQSTGEYPKEKESQLVKPETIQGCYELGTLNWRPALKLGEDQIFIIPAH